MVKIEEKPNLHANASHINPDVLINLLKEKVKEAEKERKYVEKTGHKASEQMQKAKGDLIKLLQEEIEQNEKAAKLAQSKVDKTNKEKRKTELKLKSLRGKSANINMI